MNQYRELLWFALDVAYDEVTQVWTATSNEVPGLTTEADSLAALLTNSQHSFQNC